MPRWMPCRYIETNFTATGTMNRVHDEVGNPNSIKVLATGPPAHVVVARRAWPPDTPPSGHAGEAPRNLGLADPCFALQERRALHPRVWNTAVARLRSAM